MTDKPADKPSDEMLVAFLDGELDPAGRRAVEAAVGRDAEVADRLDFLKTADLPFAAGFDALLAQAPVARLQAMIPSRVSAVPAPGVRRPDRRWVLAAACLAAGVVVDRSVAALTGDGWLTDRHQWRAVVANYMMLYSADTLNNPTSGPGPGPQEMARLSEAVGLDVSLAEVEIPGLALKRAQMLQYEGAPLVQIAYLDPASGPLAFCFIRKAGRDEGLRSERRLGMTVVYWSTPTHAFLVIGHDAGQHGGPALETIARDLKGRIAA